MKTAFTVENHISDQWQKHLSFVITRVADAIRQRLLLCLGQIAIVPGVEPDGSHSFCPLSSDNAHGSRSQAKWEGKIERYHRSMKIMVNLQNYYLPTQLEIEIGSFVNYYSHDRYHKSLDNLTSADLYFGRTREVLTRGAQLKRPTLRQGGCITCRFPQYDFCKPSNYTLANCLMDLKCSDNVQTRT